MSEHEESPQEEEVPDDGMQGSDPPADQTLEQDEGEMNEDESSTASSSWDVLAESLGAEVRPDATEHPNRESNLNVRRVPEEIIEADSPSADWDALADELGLLGVARPSRDESQVDSIEDEDSTLETTSGEEESETYVAERQDSPGEEAASFDDWEKAAEPSDEIDWSSFSDTLSDDEAPAEQVPPSEKVSSGTDASNTESETKSRQADDSEADLPAVAPGDFGFGILPSLGKGPRAEQPRAESRGEEINEALFSSLDESDSTESAEPEESAPEEAAEEPRSRRKRRPRRRRGGRDQSKKREETESATEGEESSGDKGADNSGDEGDSEEAPRQRSRSRRRRRRGGRDRDRREGDEAPADDNRERDDQVDDEIDEEGDSPRRDGRRDPEGGRRPIHKNIPSWEDSIAVIIETNMNSRSSSSRRSSRNNSRGRGRGRRGNSGN